MRENETPSQRTKREKAAERQRRKRERDRQANLNSSAIQTGDQQAPISTVSAPDLHQQDMSPEEISRRDRVRVAARERQRKHRALVKQRKMRELGLDPMGNELIPGMEEVQYRVHPDGQYTVLPPELQHPPPPPPHGMPEPPFPQGQIHGGQTFASTLLLSFSCTPLLKQHLLRTLSMSNEELASLEPIIAQAWDHWDQQVRTATSLSRGNASWLIVFCLATPAASNPLCATCGQARWVRSIWPFPSATGRCGLWGRAGARFPCEVSPFTCGTYSVPNLPTRWSSWASRPLPNRSWIRGHR